MPINLELQPYSSNNSEINVHSKYRVNKLQVATKTVVL